MSKRFKNIGFWISLLALIPLAAQVFFGYSFPAEYANLCNGLLAFIVAAGIVNNPTSNSKGFLDDK